MSSTFIIIGSSRGFGRALIEACLHQIRIAAYACLNRFVLVTTSRTKAIAAFKDAFKAVMDFDYDVAKNQNIEVIIEESNLMEAGECLRIQQLVSVSINHRHDPLEKLYVFLNAGSVDPVGPIVTKSHTTQGVITGQRHFIDALHHHSSLNFVSFLSLRAILQDVVKLHADSSTLARPLIRIVNVSSLAAVKELYGMATYCAIKCARESFCRSCVLELGRDHAEIDCKILNYAPGPMDTDLVRQGLMSPTVGNNEVKSGGHAFVDANETAKKCLRLLVQDDHRWASGDHLDFYDSV